MRRFLLISASAVALSACATVRFEHSVIYPGYETHRASVTFCEAF